MPKYPKYLEAGRDSLASVGRKLSTFCWRCETRLFSDEKCLCDKCSSTHIVDGFIIKPRKDIAV